MIRTALLTALALVLSAAPALAQGEKIYDRILKSTVWIVVPLKDKAQGNRVPIQTGTGTLIDAQKRVVLTNYHVVGEHAEVFCLFPDQQNKKIIPERKHYLDMINASRGIRCTVLAKEPKVDLALIQLAALPEGAQVMPLVKDSVSPGQQVHSVGNPGVSGALWVYTPGKVRQVYQKQFKAGEPGGTILDIDARVVETDSPTNPGDSGGPLVNDRCELVGVTQGGARNAQSVSTFIEVSEVKTLLSKSKIRPVIASGAPDKEPAKKVEKPAPAKAETTEERNERLAATRLKQANEYLEKGKMDEAHELFQVILTQYPKSKAAGEAKEQIEKLKKKK